METTEGTKVWGKWLATERGKAHVLRIAALERSRSMPEAPTALELFESDESFEAWWRGKRRTAAKTRGRRWKAAKKAAGIET